ncbi:hypothetical protein BALCAV_0201635 [Alkalihalobacillus alcalophilus ATCC 27647 = CGMCC 1.3604]|nr:hypothetical protein [Alkalihalobacillus alcalophilus]KGA98973.1 hypothetical protein BALCAV_0201635 [Alkalihalobacillus alcalophilus ATCC 27647 = CGMCC 1.3604]MED1562014.1 hypothetical protein [Alkalihalobacillus alcalophilus]
MFLILSGCSDDKGENYQYLFAGEGEFWQADYLYEGAEIFGEENGITVYSNKYRDKFILTFKGTTEDIQPLKKIEFSFDTSLHGSSSAREFDRPPNNLTFTMDGGGDGMKLNEDEVIQVNVKWNEFEESFELVKRE